MISRGALEHLERIVGPEHVVTHPDGLAEYASDGTKLRFMPDGVVFPATEKEVSEILILANRKGFPVIPRGAGSGMSGGALPVRGGLVMVLSRFDRILAIDQENLTARVEPGVITADLQKAVEKLGLFYPPDPASVAVSTIGGNVAECAGGLRAVKYGVTKDYVLGLDVVLPTGEALRTGVSTMKGVAGYDLARLIVGSEGTLAVITAITLRLLPKPESKKTMVALFSDVGRAMGTVSRLISQRIIPTALEFLDRLCMECVEDRLGFALPSEAQALLLIEVDGERILIDQESKRIERVCAAEGAITFQAPGEEGAERIWDARRDVSPSLYRLRPHKISEDVVVPRSRLPDLVAHLSRLTKSHGLPIAAFGHAGDGNLHVNVMHDKNAPGESENALAVVEEVFRRVIELQGTITGEHGVGITKAPYLGMEISPAGIALMSRIKKSFDPKGILNPGKIFPSKTIR